MSFFRYPGGKRKLLPEIRKQLDEWIGLGAGVEYREPFVGAGSVCVDVMGRYPHLDTIWINDRDMALVCLWRSIADKDQRKALKDMVDNFTPSVSEFYRIKDILSKERDGGTVELGFYKLAIHQISYSGLGVMSAGPLGGKGQGSPYKIDCRWNPQYINKRIDEIGRLLDARAVTITNISYMAALQDTPPDKKVVLYVDPPYYGKGSELYQHSFTVGEHQRLAHYLAQCPHQWLLSYDDAPEIVELYQGWTEIRTVDVAYSITNSRSKPELLIKRL